MSRPSRNTDEKLIRAGRRLLPKTGISGLGLRRVAAAARVNPGMFHYNFGTKQKFVRRVLDDLRVELAGELRLEVPQEAPPRERLRGALEVLARFAARRRKLLLAVLPDLLRGEPEAARWAREIFPGQVLQIAALARECQKVGVLSKVLPQPALLAYLLGATVMPVFALQWLERVCDRKQARLGLLGESAIARRVELALRGLAA